MFIGNIKCYGIIYKITNKISNKSYIGQTIQGFNKRYNYKGVGIERVYNYHLWNKNNNRTYNDHLLKAIDKYSLDAFDVSEVIDVAFSKIELDIKELFYIKLYDSYNNGYNYTLGGDGTIGLKGENHGMYGKGYKLVGENNGMYGVRRFGEENPMYGVSRYGKENPMYGRTQSESSRKKMSENHYDASGSNNPRAKSVICLTTGVKFNTIKEAALFYNIKSKSSISACCKGNRKYCGILKDGTKLEWDYLRDKSDDILLEAFGL